MTVSEIVHFRQNQTLHEQAAQQALHGFAAVASHASITARVERGARHLLALLEAGEYDTVAHLMETTAWARAEELCPMMMHEQLHHEPLAKGESSL